MTPTSDTNRSFFQHASDLMNELNIRYMEAEFDEQVQLKDELDQAITNFSKARLTILKSNIICTPEDVKQMQQLRQQLSKAHNINQVLNTVVGFASFVRQRFL